MTRAALFVLAVAGLVYLGLEVAAEAWLGRELDPALLASVSVVAGVLAWTGFLFRMADRLGRREDTWHDLGGLEADRQEGVRHPERDDDRVERDDDRVERDDDRVEQGDDSVERDAGSGPPSDQ